MFYRLINLTGFTCSTGCRPVHVCPVMTMCACIFARVYLCGWGFVCLCVRVCAHAHTLLQRLHGGGGLQWDQALSLKVEDMLLLKLLHLDQLLLEGQLLTA